jgi:hypothetical protein
MSNICESLKQDLENYHNTYYSLYASNVADRLGNNYGSGIPGSYACFNLTDDLICKYCNSKNSFKDNICTQCGAHL